MKIHFQILIAFYFCCGLVSRIDAQNLIPNPSFEDENICVEFNAPCAPEGWFYIRPTSNPIYFAKTAVGPLVGDKSLVVPVGNVYSKIKFGPFVYTMLACPLIEGITYTMSFYINTSNRKFHGLDVVFAQTDFAINDINAQNLTPSFTIIDSNVVETAKFGYKFITYNYIAKGNEAFILLGNISRPLTLSAAERMYKNGDVFCFIDDLKLIPLTPVPTCSDYQINLQLAYSQDYRHTEFKQVKHINHSETKIIVDTLEIPDVFFETGSSMIKNTFLKKMDSVAKIISGSKPINLKIVGHTDNIGSFERNQRLSENRAAEVGRYFKTTIPILHDKIQMEGKSFIEPRADNKSKEGRAKNRRVEIYLFRLVEE